MESKTWPVLNAELDAVVWFIRSVPCVQVVLELNLYVNLLGISSHNLKGRGNALICMLSGSISVH